MATICFDLGGTLIDDPFLETVEIVKSKLLDGTARFPFPNRFLDEFVVTWIEENLQFDFPFASHFLQEEVWPMRAALRVNDAHDLKIRPRLPQMVPAILDCYRTHVKENIAGQPQLATLRSALSAIRADGHHVGVASNDRDFATRAMLAWASLDVDLSFVFTSERLSQKYSSAEKPAPEFFHAIQSELKRLAVPDAPIVYVGDSEMKDIAPSMGLGWMAVRFFNPKQANSTAQWLASSNSTIAPVSFAKFEHLPEAVRRAVALVECY